MSADAGLAAANPLLVLLGLGRRARAAGSAEELAFLLVNDSHALHAYRQAALWFADGGVRALSGVVEIETNVPYVHWLDRVCRQLDSAPGGIRRIGAGDLAGADSVEWAEWLPEFGLWLPCASHPATPETAVSAARGGLLLAADQPWPDERIALLAEWLDVWSHAWRALFRPSWWSWARLKNGALSWLLPPPDTRWWKQRRVRLAALVLAVLFFPVRLSVLAHGELVPASPAAIRAPIDGVVGQFHVRPNDVVKAGQALFSFDEAAIIARLDVADQALATAQVEYRQFAQQAVTDTKSKAQLASLLGKIEERRSEAGFLRDQLGRSRVVAPHDGVALFDDPTEWIGRPVQTGERIMRIAAPGDVEVEAWLAIGDAIALPDAAALNFYLAAHPLSSLSARVRYLAHDAVLRPDGSYAYRLRARLDAPTALRVGLKGTAKVSGERVPLIYWMLRRPLATIRQTLGV